MVGLSGWSSMRRTGALRSRTSSSMRAKAQESFSGKRAELFLNNLEDQVAAMIAAPISTETAALPG